MTDPDRPRIVVRRGLQALEQALFERLERDLEEIPERLLGAPLYLIVPSHSLRHHLLARLMEHRGGSVAGLVCRTLRGLAGEILDRTGEPTPRGGELLPILVRRAARAEPALRHSLDHLRDGYRSLIGAVTDLLEAGLEPVHVEVLEEVLATDGAPVAAAVEIERAAAIVRVAGRIAEGLDALGVGHSSRLLRQAADRLRATDESPLPCSAVQVYGFADATGVATDLLEAALLRFGGTVYLDLPPDPLDPQTQPPDRKFGRRFRERLAAITSATAPTPAATPTPAPVLLAATGLQAEVRGVGDRIRRLLDAGTRPEAIAVVARQPGPYVSPLRIHFERLGIPFSAMGIAGPLLPEGRRIQALLQVLARRQGVRLDHWLETRGGIDDAVPLFDLRLALFGLGVSRLEELAGLPLTGALRQPDLPLPVRLGFSGENEPSGDVKLSRRRVPTTAVVAARQRAIDLVELFRTWGRVHRLEGHLECFDALLGHLGWDASHDSRDEVARTRTHLAETLPTALELDLEEFTQLVTDGLNAAGRDRCGGQGGGVQFLDVIEARGRTGEHLFVVGMNKGIFPRTVREDPALPDKLRHILGREGHGVLPDLPKRRTGFDEERFLFTQLLGSSPHVTLSWQIANDDNQELAVSPLVERMSWLHETIRLPPVLASEAATPAVTAPRTAYEIAVRTALAGSPTALAPVLTAAIEESDPTHATSLTEARLAILTEVDRAPGPDSRLGPYFGFVGPATDPRDPRLAQRLYITTLERLATCPWQAFVGRLLRLEALPDPVELLPGLEPVLVGQLVHRVLERWVRTELEDEPTSLEEARRCDPAVIRWPDRSTLEQRVQHEAAWVAHSHGIAWDGFARVLAAITLPVLEKARQLIAELPPEYGPVATELDCVLPAFPDTDDRPLYFRVDRIDAGAGRLLLSDFKTGTKAVSTAKKSETRTAHLLTKIRQGRLLQAAAYARAAGQEGDRGQYLFVLPDFKGPEEARVMAIEAADAVAGATLAQTLQTLLSSWHRGFFFPRLVEPDSDSEPDACAYCQVAEVCLRGDSAARGRLRDWTSGRTPVNPTEAALLGAWWLAARKERPT